MSKLSCIVHHLGNLQALAWHSLFCVAVSRTYSYSTEGSMLGRPRGIPLQRLSAHLLRAMPSWGLGSLSLAVQKVGSAQQSVRVRILRGFLKSDEFGLCGSQALRLQQQIVHVSITTAATEQSFDVAVDGFHPTHRYLRPAVV